VRDFTFAARSRREEAGLVPVSCCPSPGARFFDAQVLALERFFASGKAPYPASGRC